MPFLWLVIVGAAAGFLATRLMKWEASILVTVGLGMAGAIVGTLILRFLLATMGMMSGLIGAILGAVFLVWLWQTYGNPSNNDRS